MGDSFGAKYNSSIATGNSRWGEYCISAELSFTTKRIVPPFALSRTMKKGRFDLGGYCGVPVSAKGGGMGGVEGDAILGDQLTVKGIVCLKRAKRVKRAISSA